MGVVAQDRWGQFERARETLGRARCAHFGKGAATRNTTRARKETQGRSARAREEEEGERECCSSTAGRWATEHASGASHPAVLSRATVTCHCNKGRQTGEATTEVPRTPRQGRCCVQDSTSFDGGGSRSMAPAQPHHVPLPSHALSLLAKTAVACNVVGAPVVSVERAAGVRLIGPFLHVVSIAVLGN